MKVQAYLDFDGRCEEALELYKKALGAKVDMMMRNSESPQPHPPGMLPAGSEKKVMHATFRIGETVLGASDGHCTGKATFKGISLSLHARSDEEAQKMFAGLAEGGKVSMPLTKTFFSSQFGMVADRFGVSWMVLVDR